MFPRFRLLQLHEPLIQIVDASGTALQIINPPERSHERYCAAGRKCNVDPQNAFHLGTSTHLAISEPGAVMQILLPTSQTVVLRGAELKFTRGGETAP
jgi:hypothetical protein